MVYQTNRPKQIPLILMRFKNTQIQQIIPVVVEEISIVILGEIDQISLHYVTDLNSERCIPFPTNPLVALVGYSQLVDLELHEDTLGFWRQTFCACFFIQEVVITHPYI